MLSCLTLKIDRLSYAVLNIIAPCNNNTNLPSNQMCAHSFMEWGKDVLTLEFVLYDSWLFMLYMYWNLFFLKNVLDYEKIGVRVHILKRHKLNSSPPKRRSDVFRSKIDLRVAPKISLFLYGDWLNAFDLLGNPFLFCKNNEILSQTDIN